MTNIRLALSAVVLCGAVLPAITRADTWSDAQAAFDDRDDRRALALLERAACEGSQRARIAWGLALRHGSKVFPGLEADPVAARRWFDAVVETATRQGVSANAIDTVDQPQARIGQHAVYTPGVAALPIDCTGLQPIAKAPPQPAD